MADIAPLKPPTTGPPGSTSSSRTSARARRAICWRRCRSIAAARGRSRLRARQLDRIADRAVSRRGGDRARFVAGHAAAGARAAAALHIRRGRSCDLDAGAGHRSPVRQCRVPLGAGPSQGAGAAAAGAARGRRAGRADAGQHQRACAHADGEGRSVGPWAARSRRPSGAQRPAAAGGLLRSAASAVQPSRHLAHPLQSHHGEPRRRGRMVQGLGAAAIPRAARRGRRARHSRPGTPTRSSAPIRRASTAR